jgi:hypothetical protein
MTDVFISYAHEDQTFVRGLVQALEREGLSVWWDHTIPPGKTWDEVIARGIEQAKACIIIWSPHSISSDWVKEEATLAKDGRKYLPVQIGADQPPVGFRRIQAANLTNWRGDTNDPQWRMLAQEAKNLVRGETQGPAPSPPRPTPTPPTATGNRSVLVWLAVAALVAGGVYLLRAPPAAPTASTTPETAEAAPTEPAPPDIKTFAGTWKVSGKLANGNTFTDVPIYFDLDGTFKDGDAVGQWAQNGANVIITYQNGAIVRLALNGDTATGVVQRSDGAGEWHLTRVSFPH